MGVRQSPLCGRRVICDQDSNRQGGHAQRLPTHHHFHRLDGPSQTSSRPIYSFRTDSLPSSMQGPRPVVLIFRGPQDRIRRHSIKAGVVPSGRRPAISLDSMHKRITDSALDSWTTSFQSGDYHGHHFLALKEPKGTNISPTYAIGGSWLRFVGDDTKLCTRMCRAILNHAPIGDYYRRFNIPEEHSCPCGAARQSRDHIFTRCPNVTTVRYTPRLMKELLGFLQRNPLAFGFRPPQQGVG